MSITLKTVLAVALVAFVAACAPKAEEPAPAPIAPEPVTSKY
jgi:predicted outer membrane protein